MKKLSKKQEAHIAAMTALGVGSNWTLRRGVLIWLDVAPWSPEEDAIRADARGRDLFVLPLPEADRRVDHHSISVASRAVWAKNGVFFYGVRDNPQPWAKVFENPSRSETFEAVAFGSRGNRLGSWRAGSVRGAMDAADTSKIRSWSVVVRGEYTSDGTHQGVGHGRMVASRDSGGRWLVE